MPDIAAPAAPAPSAPAAPAAPASPATPAAAPPAAAPVAAPAPVASPATPATPAAYDPKTAAAPPKSSDFANTAEGIVEFARSNSEWSSTHPEEAEKIRAAKIAAEDGIEAPTTSPEASVAAEVAAAEGKQPDEPAEPAAEPVAAPTPAAIEEWTSKSPELKAAFEKSPELKSAVMKMARENEAVKPILDIVSTPEEARFAVDHANRLVSLQTNWMLSAEDPEMIAPAWDQTVEFFKERDDNGKEIIGADGKPQLGADFKPFIRKAATTAMGDLASSVQGKIAAIEARLNGNYPTEEARTADSEALDDAKYEKAAFDFVMQRLSNDEQNPKLPALPPNATPEQIAFQKQLEAQQKKIDAETGKQSADSRRTAAKTLDREVQNHYEAGINRYIDTQVAAMKERNEYLPDFVLTNKWINPQTGQATKVSDFGARIYLELNAKIHGNPTNSAALGRMQSMGAAGKAMRLAEIDRLTTLYLPKIFNTEVKRIQDGIRASSGKAPVVNGQVARVEPQSQGTVVPSTMSSSETRAWAEAEAKKDPSYPALSSTDRETMIISLGMKKKYGG